MTDTHARTTADVLLVSAGVAAACVILTRPPLRRLAFWMARLWLGASLVRASQPYPGRIRQR